MMNLVAGHLHLAVHDLRLGAMTGAEQPPLAAGQQKAKAWLVTPLVVAGSEATVSCSAEVCLQHMC
jgi:hypothetical protein